MSDPSPHDAAEDRPSLEQAIEKLSETGTAELTDEEGALIAVAVRSFRGATMRGGAPRLQVAEGKSLLGRMLTADGRPWLVELRIETAEYESADVAVVNLRALSVNLDPSRRQEQRSSMGGVATLTAVHCRDIVDGDTVEGSIVDLAPGGLAFASRRVLRTGDRLLLTARFFNETIAAEVRVRSVREAQNSGQNVYGCSFIHLAPADAAKLEELLEHPGHDGSLVDLGALRRLVDDGDSGRGWRNRLFGS